MNLREQIEKVDDLCVTKVEVKEWPGVDVFVHKVRAEQIDAIVTLDETKPYYWRACEVAAAYLCDKNGKVVFPGEEGLTPGDQLMVLKKDIGALRVIIDAGHSLNGFTAKEQEKAAKNSKRLRGGG